MSKLNFRTDKELLNAIKTITLGKGQSFASIVATTAPRMTKKHRETKVLFSDIYKGEVYKTYKISCNINVNYENAVNNQLQREDKKQLTFSGYSLPYGNWVEGLENIVIEYKGEYQLRYFTGMSNNTKGDITWHYANGEQLTEWEISQLSGFLSKKSPAKNQGTEKEIKPRNIKFAGITEIKMNGQTLIRK